MDRKPTIRTGLTLFACLLIAQTMISCGGGDSPTQPSPTETVLASATLDAGGGTLAHDELELLVPAGAFDQAADISLVRLTENPAGTPDAPAYRVDGLPATFAADLTVSFPAGKAETPSVFLVGEQAFVSSLNQVTTSFTAAVPVTMDGRQTVTLPAIAAESGASAVKSVEGITSVVFVEAHEPHTLLSSGGHFHITWLGPVISPDDIAALATYLEEAHAHFLALGFSYEARTSWPVEVLLRPMPLPKFGGYSSSKRGHNYGYIEFNTLHIADRAAMRVTAGHEFFHLVQSFSDHRWSYFRAIGKSLHHWLDEAASVWSEAAFSDDPNYVSSARDGVELQPFEGMEAGRLEDSEPHGYGMSALVKYLVDSRGTDILPLIYSHLQPEVPATRAVELAAGDISGWWSDFLKAYVLAEIYPLPPSDVSALRKGTFTIRGAQDSHWSATQTYPDHSGRVFVVALADQDLPDGANLDLALGGDHSRLLVFTYSSTQMAFLAEGAGSLNVPGLRSIKDAGRNILVVAVQNHGEPDYLNQEQLTLTATVNRPEVDLGPFTDVYFRWSLGVEQLFGDGTTGQEPYSVTEFHGSGLSVSGREFSCPVDTYQDWFGVYTRHYSGSIAGTFNAALDTVLTVTASLRLEYIYPEEVAPSFQYTLSAENLPLHSYWPDSSGNWRREGAEACAAVTGFSFESFAYDWQSTGIYCQEEYLPYVQVSLQRPPTAR